MEFSCFYMGKDFLNFPKFPEHPMAVKSFADLQLQGPVYQALG
jgi:hypothetical protein